MTSPVIDHVFGGAPRTVAVHLTVFDSQGGSNTTFRLITIQ